MKGTPQPERDGLAHGDADDQAADQARARRSRRPRRSLEAEPGLGERLADRGIEQLDMGARGDLRHHAAIGRMQIELRAHHVRQDLAAAVAVRGARRRPRSRRSSSRCRARSGSVFAVRQPWGFL